MGTDFLIVIGVLPVELLLNEFDNFILVFQ